jgi:hypothetical protein
MGIKKVRYAAGALGMLLAGLLAQPSYAATSTASLQRQVQPAATDCTGDTLHEASAEGVTLKFWSTPDGSRICIGTIEVTGSPASTVTAYVQNANGNFCVKSASGTSVTDSCHDVFVAPLAVYGTRLYNGILYYVFIELPQP